MSNLYLGSKKRQLQGKQMQFQPRFTISTQRLYHDHGICNSGGSTVGATPGYSAEATAWLGQQDVTGCKGL